MDMLKNKLYELELTKHEEFIKELKGVNESINFGSQIRNYVLEPYTLVKDSRTGYQTSDALRVLDGDILGFMEACLKFKE
jgi:peptide chain release factor 2